MNMKTYALLLGLVTLVSACAGEQNEASASNTVLAVKNSQLPNGEADGEPMVAVLDATNPDEVKAKANAASYIPMSSLPAGTFDFKSDEELTNGGDQIGGSGDEKDNAYYSTGACGACGCGVTCGRSVRTTAWRSTAWIAPARRVFTGSCGVYSIGWDGACVRPVSMGVVYQPIAAFPCEPIVPVARRRTTITTTTTTSWVRVFGGYDLGLGWYW